MSTVAEGIAVPDGEMPPNEGAFCCRADFSASMPPIIPVNFWISKESTLSLMPLTSFVIWRSRTPVPRASRAFNRTKCSSLWNCGHHRRLGHNSPALQCEPAGGFQSLLGLAASKSHCFRCHQACLRRHFSFAQRGPSGHTRHLSDPWAGATISGPMGAGAFDATSTG